ncbi:MAG: rhodanese-like domain-containing protein [Flavobacteriaceae bacterium]|jgi:rhodanese-related sulfurtransferase|nr:rhodanese-like domain-containing protein [Flavobacteriaceae bacterium]
MSDLTQQEWASQLESDSTSIILDVRTDAEVEEGMIPEAKHLDIHQGQGFISALEKLDKTNTYYVYCRSGARSGQACSIMKQMGFEHAYNLLGGFNEWDGATIIPEEK